jgi:membrane protein YqaA with SNARE-associated domain
MDTAALIGQCGPAAATLLVSLVGAIAPFVYIEVFLLAAVALVPADYPVWTLAVVAACGQMGGKSVLYWSAATATRCRAWHRTDSGYVDRLQQRLASMGLWAALSVTFASASSGIPPFILVAIVAGAARVRFWPFLLAGFAGRTLRMLGVVLGAAAVRHAIS